ncbi:MAG: transglutaminase family protein [Cyanobacteria bacterium J06639_14]
MPQEHYTRSVSIQSFSSEQWNTINALGHHIDQVLDEAGIGLTMGGEPTYISDQDRDSLQWRYIALGENKRQIAGQLLRLLQQRLNKSGSLLHYGLGKLYPGEPWPRWAWGCFWRIDGERLWRNSHLLARGEIQTQYTWQTAKTFITELLRCFALPSDALIAAFDPDASVPRGFVLPFLTVAYQGQTRWQSCPWTDCEERLTLLPGEAAPLGLRLPLADIPSSEHLLEEAVPALSTPPIRPQQQRPLAPQNSIRLALTVEVRQTGLHVFMPPIASARSYVDVLTAIEATAEFLDQPVVIEGFPPPGNQGIQGFQITPDPGVLEVNIHPAASWPELVALHTTLDEAAIACGLTGQKYSAEGRCLGSGGGAHITIGGLTPDTSPLLRRPDLLRSFITYWQHHPSLSYLFAGQFIGPTCQAPRVDEGRHDNLYELELALLALSPRESVAAEVIDQLLSPLLRDVTGNSHRTALCIDKLFPVQNPQLQLGLLEFRGFEMPSATGLRLLQMLLIRAFVAWFWQQPFTRPLKRWGPALHDRWLFPYYLQQDFRAVLTDLRAAGYAFELEWFTLFWEQQFPRYGKVSLIENPSPVMELRAALEPWPVLGDVSSGAASQPVDNSLERLQISLTGVVGDTSEPEALAQRYGVFCNGYRVPMRFTGTPGHYVGGIRFRARSALSQPPSLLAPHTPLICHVIDTLQGKWVGGARYHVQPPSGDFYTTLPRTLDEARSRVSERFEPLRQGTIPSPLPSFILHPDTPITLDLRLASHKVRK